MKLILKCFCSSIIKLIYFDHDRKYVFFLAKFWPYEHPILHTYMGHPRLFTDRPKTYPSPSTTFPLSIVQDSERIYLHRIPNTEFSVTEHDGAEIQLTHFNHFLHFFPKFSTVFVNSNSTAVTIQFQSRVHKGTATLYTHYSGNVYYK